MKTITFFIKYKKKPIAQKCTLQIAKLLLLQFGFNDINSMIMK